MIERIRELCKLRNITIQKLEIELGFGAGSIGRHANIRADRLKQIADYFGVTMEWLITGENENSQIDTELIPYLSDESIKKLVLFAGNSLPQDKEEREKFVDALITTITAIQGISK